MACLYIPDMQLFSVLSHDSSQKKSNFPGFLFLTFSLAETITLPFLS
jgi:hypothetical protein